MVSLFIAGMKAFYFVIANDSRGFGIVRNLLLWKLA